MSAEERLVDVAAAIADGTAIDWGAATKVLGDSSKHRLLDGLKLIAEVAGRGRTMAPAMDIPPSRPGTALRFDGDGPPSRAAMREGAGSAGAPADGLVSRAGWAPGDPAPRTWGPLRIIERVGGGMFGDVFRAWDTRLDREVALKILHRRDRGAPPAPSSAGAETVEAIEEGRLLARVRHPNVVTVYGAERIDGQVGVWMEFVHGPTLEHELSRHGPFDLERLVRVAVDLAEAVSAVHRAGLLHRDIKTHNILCDGDGRTLLTDFGAGELAGASSGSPVGTPLYVAPEVAAGRPASSQSDIYSLGVVLFRLATGRYPVEGQTLEDIRTAHARGARLSLSALRPDLPASIVGAIERALEPDPSRRYPDADALCVAFSSVAERSGVLPAPRTVYDRSARPWRVASVAVAALVAAASGATVLYRTPRAPAVAVLPLKNLASDADGDALADGLTDAIIRQLTMVRGLDVRSRTSSFALRGRPITAAEAGRQLRSDYLLTGSVLHAQGRIRIHAQLVRVADDASIWAGSIDRDFRDLLDVQDEISRAIVNELRVKLDPAPRRYDIDASTYERYLRARSLSERKDRESLQTAIALYREVAASEPRFAPAYTGLADAYADYEFWGVNFADTYAQIREAASRALALDPQLPEAHASMGLVYARDRRWADAEGEFERSLQINGNLSRTRRAYAFWLLYQEGRLEAALAQLQLALEHDPLSLDVRRMMGYVQLSAGQYAAALETCRYVLKEDPKFPLIRLVFARALLLTGAAEEALRLLESLAPNRAPELGYAYAVLGRRREAEALARAAADVPLTEAVIYAGLRESDRVFDALERAAAIGDPKIGAILTYPELAFLRSDPRMAAFRERLGLAAIRR